MKHLLFIIVCLFFCKLLNAQDTISVKTNDRNSRAIFGNGEESLVNYLAAHVKYPEEARNKGITGTVEAQLTITEQGNVMDVEIVKGLFPSIDLDFLNVVKKMPNWKPAYKNGQPVAETFNISRTFKIDEESDYFFKNNTNKINFSDIINGLPPALYEVAKYQYGYRLNKALAEMDTIISQNPNNADYLVCKALIYIDKQDKARACESLYQAELLNKKFPYSKNSTSFKVDQLMRKVCKGYNKAFPRKADPKKLANDKETERTTQLLKPVIELKQKKRFTQAHEQLDKLIESNPTNIDIIVYEALIFIEEKKYNKAKDILFKVQDLGDTNGYTPGTTREGILLLLAKYGAMK